MKTIEAVVFDWAGTTVDYGCMAPIHAMKEAFSQKKVDVTIDEIRAPMGMLKIDHIKTILDMDRVKLSFRHAHNREYEMNDVNEIYHDFEKCIFSILDQHTKVIDGVLEIQAFLRKNNIKIASTTGYTNDMIAIVAESANKQGYHPDYIISGDQVKKGRPYPDMIEKISADLNLHDMKRVIKVGDTIVDIEEGLNAGCYTVGVVEGSSMLGLSEREVTIMDRNELSERISVVTAQMKSAGAHYVINTLYDLPNIIEQLNSRTDHAVRL